MNSIQYYLQNMLRNAINKAIHPAGTCESCNRFSSAAAGGIDENGECCECWRVRLPRETPQEPLSDIKAGE